MPALAREPRILDRLIKDLRKGGLVGEDRTAKLVFLAVVSRSLDRPLSIILKVDNPLYDSCRLPMMLEGVRMMIELVPSAHPDE